MKKLFAVLLICLFGTTVAMAQKFEPNTRWPYLYENFIPGTIYFDGNKKSEAELNIHLWGNVLHYLDDNQRIMQSKDKGILRVEIGGDAYIFCDHKLAKLLTAEQNNLVVLLTEADFDALSQNTGAYGASLNSAAVRELSSLDLGGMDMPEVGKLLQERADGRTLSLRSHYYFVIDGKQLDASKKVAESLLNSEGQQGWKAFLKQEKIKWKDEESLGKVLHYINAHMIGK